MRYCMVIQCVPQATIQAPVHSELLKSIIVSSKSAEIEQLERDKERKKKRLRERDKVKLYLEIFRARLQSVIATSPFVLVVLVAVN